LQRPFFFRENNNAVDQQQADKLTTWFDNYVAGFYSDDEYANANFNLKDRHSRRVCREMLYLADELDLPDHQRPIAQTIGLFHDIGRFDQFEEYRTYNDLKSVNHCLLGLEVLARTNALAEIDPAERQLIEKAIEYHGLKDLPPGLSGESLLFSRMIRDADKLDVFYVVVKYYQQYTENPDRFMLEVGLPDEPQCSPDVIEAILKEELIDYRSLKTLNDMKLMQLGWVYNINFTPTLKRIKQRRFIETLLGFLPRTPQTRKIEDKIRKYVDSRLRQQ